MKDQVFRTVERFEMTGPVPDKNKIQKRVRYGFKQEGKLSTDQAPVL